jgi:hypothetical protein
VQPAPSIENPPAKRENTEVATGSVAPVIQNIQMAREKSTPDLVGSQLSEHAPSDATGIAAVAASVSGVLSADEMELSETHVPRVEAAAAAKLEADVLGPSSTSNTQRAREKASLTEDASGVADGKDSEQPPECTEPIECALYSTINPPSGDAVAET